MPAWVGWAIGGLGKLMGAIGGLVDRWTQNQHDADVKKQQQTADALQGESDAIKENDRINNAVDGGGVPIASDPANRNR